jgi:hypothetical protein
MPDEGWDHAAALPALTGLDDALFVAILVRTLPTFVLIHLQATLFLKVTHGGDWG